MLRKVFGGEKEEGEHFIARSFVMCTVHKILR
jgi:hypothetical protein